MVKLAGPGDSDWVQANPGWLCGTIIANGQPNPSHGKGYLCPAEQGQFCTSSLGDPNYGNTGFDNLGETALLMIQVKLLPFGNWPNGFGTLHLDRCTATRAGCTVCRLFGISDDSISH